MTSKKILVIDDSPDRHEWFREVLFGLFDSKIELFEADTDVEALDYFRRYTFDLVFFDHDLGMASPMSGSDIASEILNNVHEEFYLPRAIWVHSSNYSGARNIASKFQSAGIANRIEAFSLIATYEENFKNTVEGMLNEV